MSELQRAVARDGFAIQRQLLDAAEVGRLRKGLKAHFARRWNWEGLGKHQPGAALAVPEIGWLFAHPGVVAAFRELTGSDRPVFTGNCDAHLNMLSWWHKDTSEKEGGCLPGDCFGRPSVPVFRAGVYLQDHDRDGHGLHVRRGSHRTRSLDQGEVESLRTRAGDVVFFDIRVTHAGQFADPLERALLKGARRLPAAAWRAKEAWRALRGKQEKMSIFFTYGAPGPDTDFFCDFEAAAQRRRSGALTLPAGVAAALSARGVGVNPHFAAEPADVRETV